MKKLIGLLCVIILLLNITGCSSNDGDKSNSPSSEAVTIMDSLKPDERIDDYIDAYGALEMIGNENSKDYTTALQTLYEISEKYEMDKEDNLKSYLEGKDISILVEALSGYKIDFFYKLVAPVYREKKEFEFTLPISVNEFNKTCYKEGYLYKEDHFNMEYSTTYYKNESLNGDRVIADYDCMGKIGQFYTTLKNGESLTAQQSEALSSKTEEEKDRETAALIKKNMNNVKIKENSFFNLIYGDEEINKIQSIFTNINEEWLIQNDEYLYDTSDFRMIEFTVDMGNTELIISGDSMSNVSAYISVENYYYDKYHSELNLLMQEYMGDNYYNEQEHIYKTIDEVLNELPISQTNESAGVEAEKVENSTLNIDTFKNSITNTWLMETTEGDGSEKTFYYVFNEDGTGSHSIKDATGSTHQLSSFSYTVSSVSEDGKQGIVICNNDKSNKTLNIKLTGVSNGVVLIDGKEYRLKE